MHTQATKRKRLSTPILLSRLASNTIPNPSVQSQRRLIREIVQRSRTQANIDPSLNARGSTTAPELRRKLHPSCTKRQMIKDINATKNKAKERIKNARTRVRDNPRAIKDELWQCFAINLNKKSHWHYHKWVRNRIERMFQLINTTDVLFVCGDAKSARCQGVSARSTNCSNAEGMELCLSSKSRLVGNSNDWVKTFVHEYVHLSCDSDAYVYSSKDESYSMRKNARENVKNPWNYAKFIMKI